MKMNNRPTRAEIGKMPNGDYRIACIDELSGSASAMQLPPDAYEQLRHHFNPRIEQWCEWTADRNGNSACHIYILMEYENKVYKDSRRLSTHGEYEDSIKWSMEVARRQMSHNMLDEILNEIPLPEITSRRI